MRRVMELVLILTTAPDRPALDDALTRHVRNALAIAGGSPGAVDWLAPGIACDIAFTAADAKAAQAAARLSLAGQPVDANVVPAQGRRKRLLVADMDATIVEAETLDELAALAGVADRVVPITERAMRGEINFREAVVERVALLEGQPRSIIDRALAGLRYTPGGRTLVATMRANGATCALVSGGFDAFTRPVAAAVGFDRSEGNHLIEADGRLTGRVREPILGKDAKRVFLEEMAAERGLGLDDAVTVGDGANDIPMLQAAGLGVGFRAKPLVRESVPVSISHGDLTALLYLQGYRAAEFVAA
jgi:phosphoserine phosphatase